MTDVRGHLLPVYVLVDESASMKGVMSELNEGLRSLREALLDEPMTAAKVRLSVLGFSDTTVRRLSLVDMRSAVEMPLLVSRSTTMFGAAFDALRMQIPIDVHSLKTQNYQVYRPVAVLLSDGVPNDAATWRGSLAQLKDRGTMSASPHIISCGIGAANAAIILDIATRREFAFVAPPNSRIGPTIAGFFVSLVNSVVQSGRTVGSDHAEVSFEKPEGFRMAMDVI